MPKKTAATIAREALTQAIDEMGGLRPAENSIEALSQVVVNTARNLATQAKVDSVLLEDAANAADKVTRLTLEVSDGKMMAKHLTAERDAARGDRDRLKEAFSMTVANANMARMLVKDLYE